MISIDMEDREFNFIVPGAQERKEEGDVFGAKNRLTSFYVHCAEETIFLEAEGAKQGKKGEGIGDAEKRHRWGFFQGS